MAPQSAQTDALRARDLFLYAMKNGVSVVIGGHDVRVVGVAHEDVGALLSSAKHRRKREGSLFWNILKKKIAAKFEKIGVKLVPSHQLYRAV